jgi:N6-adenosine-specific RNA methylase IME4
MTRYRTIVADPPWDYEPFVSINRTAGKWSERVEKPLSYPAMTLAAIAALPIADLADPRGAFLFIWTTNRYLPDTFELIEGWGFTYRQTLVWHKVNGTPFGGSFAPNHAEFLLACRRGTVRREGKLPSSVVSIRHNAKIHSRKPDVFMDEIERVSPEPRLEMFARRQRLGWDTWGNEALNHVEMGA